MFQAHSHYQCQSLTNIGLSDGIRLARPGLPICKDSGVEALEKGLDERLHARRVDLLLAAALLKDEVAVKMAVVTQRDPLLLRVGGDAALMAVQELLGQQGADSDCDLHRGVLGPARHWAFGRHGSANQQAPARPRF